MNQRTTSLPIAELVEDESIYPRHAVDREHVTALTMALQSGAVLPPLIVDKASKRIVDGWHRVRCYRRVIGETAVVDVELRAYANDGEILLDAIALNATHGRRLDRQDQVRSVLLGERAGVTEVQLATVLHMPVERIPTLRIRFAGVPEGTPDAVPGTNTIALKRPVAHLAGVQLTSAQAAAHHSAPGTSYLMVVHQIRDALRFELVNQADQRLQAALLELRDELAKYLG